MAFNIFDHFIPIVWKMGHMGTFLQNFLTQGVPYQFPLSTSQGMVNINKEWLFEDALDNFFGSPIDKYAHIYNSLSSTYSGTELTEQAAIKVFEQKYKKIIKSDEISFDIVKNNSSRYIKEHYSLKHGSNHLVSNVRWKNKKIYCRYPDEYSWIPYFLLKYKFTMLKWQSLHGAKVNNVGTWQFASPISKSNDLRYLENKLHTNKDRSYIENENDLILNDTVNEYIQFDIYNLVINKNTDQVYQIDPNFEFDIDKKNMLNTAHTTTLEILNLFGLNPNWKIDNTTTVEEVLAWAKL